MTDTYEELKAKVDLLEKRELEAYEGNWNDGGFHESVALRNMKRVLSEHRAYVDGVKSDGDFRYLVGMEDIDGSVRFNFDSGNCEMRVSGSWEITEIET